MKQLKVILRLLAGATVVVCAYWNIVFWLVTAQSLPPRDADEVVAKEQRLAGVRANLLSLGYKGDVGFITERDLLGKPPLPEDDKQWGQSQYVMIPWVLVRRKDTPFVIADFWDGVPPSPPEGFSYLYDAGQGLILLKAKQRP